MGVENEKIRGFGVCGWGEYGMKSIKEADCPASVLAVIAS